MIARDNRFHGLGSLRFTYKKGRTVRSQFVAVKYVLNEKRQAYRCAVVVSKKVSKSAVVRNRIRRRIMEVVRTHQAQITQPYDLVITVYNAEVAEMPAKDLADTLKSLLMQAGVIS